jgi:hypothetical protein
MIGHLSVSRGGGWLLQDVKALRIWSSSFRGRHADSAKMMLLVESEPERESRPELERPELIIRGNSSPLTDKER